MEYQLGPFQLLAQENRIVSPDGEQSIRPKTLELLLYLINNASEILSKQRLLDAVWQSPVTQEHVLFQSINEIRNLFKPLNVIKTYPRKGYQWIGEARLLPASQPQPSVETRPRRTGWLPLALASLLLLPIAWYFVGFGAGKAITSDQPLIASASVPEMAMASRELVILPINNQVRGSAHDWVRLGAMDMMIKKLHGEPGFMVFSAEDVMQALARSDTFDLIDIEQQSRALRAHMGEVVTLHSKLLGAPMDYQLHYSLIGRYQIKQGIVFATHLPDLLKKLMNEVMTQYQAPYDMARAPIAKQTADHNFLQAMESFHRQDFQAANHYFSALLQTTPDNVTAQRYLLQSLIAQQHYTQAAVIGEQALNMAQIQQQPIEHLRILFELGVLASRQHNFERADRLISQSQALAEQHGDQLYVAYAHTQLGHLMMQQAQWSQAETLYTRALTYHQGFACPYGQISNLGALAKLEQQQGKQQGQLHYLDKAIAVANKNAMRFEHIHLLLNKVDLANNANERQLLLYQAEQLMQQLDKPQLQQQISTRLRQLGHSTLAQNTL